MSKRYLQAGLQAEGGSYAIMGVGAISRNSTFSIVLLGHGVVDGIVVAPDRDLFLLGHNILLRGVVCLAKDSWCSDAKRQESRRN
jgi:hypothetical protein